MVPLLVPFPGFGPGPGPGVGLGVGPPRRNIVRLNHNEEYFTNFYIHPNMHREMIMSLYTNLLHLHIHIHQDDDPLRHLNIQD